MFCLIHTLALMFNIVPTILCTDAYGHMHIFALAQCTKSYLNGCTATQESPYCPLPALWSEVSPVLQEGLAVLLPMQLHGTLSRHDNFPFLKAGHAFKL